MRLSRIPARIPDRRSIFLTGAAIGLGLALAATAQAAGSGAAGAARWQRAHAPLPLPLPLPLLLSRGFPWEGGCRWRRGAHVVHMYLMWDAEREHRYICTCTYSGRQWR